jgi:hypothetical protein
VKTALFRILFIAIATFAVVPAGAASRGADLDTWVSVQLAPYLAQTLSTHPRFRNEAVRFVVMQDGNPLASSNALAIALRNQIQDALVDTPGIRIAWQPDRIDINRSVKSQRIDCAANDVHYYIGLEITEARSGRFEVGVRALDLEEHSWVSGFGMAWSGMLTAMQHRAWQQYEDDPSFRGDREVPYLDTQSDLLAAHLAHNLGCTLLRQVSGEYTVQTLDNPAQSAPANDIVELVGNNLAYYRALQITNDNGKANARVEGKAHQIDDDLYQYWVTVTPIDATEDLPVLSASAYIYLAEEMHDVEVVAAIPSKHPGTVSSGEMQPQRGVLQSVQLVELHDKPTWYALQTRTSKDSVLFYLNYQQGNGLVRLADSNCERHVQARIARADEYLQFGLPGDHLAGARWASADNWQAVPDDESYYVVAVTDSRAARQIARQIELLPKRCGTSVRPGLEGRELEQWLRDFSAITARTKYSVDWRIIHVKSVF